MFDENPKFGEARLVDEHGHVLRKIRTFSFNRSPTERVTLLDPVLAPIANSVDVKVEGDTLRGTFKVNVLSHSGMFIHETFVVVPSVTCDRKTSPHALNSHGEGYDCLQPKEVKG